MPRRREPVRIIKQYAPDPARCAQALLRLLDWEPSQDHGETSEDHTPAAKEAHAQGQRTASSGDDATERTT
jgi:hypothetical protein